MLFKCKSKIGDLLNRKIILFHRSNLFYAYLRSICIHLRQNKRVTDHLSSVSKRARLKYHSILLAIVRRRFVSISKQPIYSSRAESSTHAAHYSRSPIRCRSICCSSCCVNYYCLIYCKKIKKISRKYYYNIFQRITFHLIINPTTLKWTNTRVNLVDELFRSMIR